MAQADQPRQHARRMFGGKHAVRVSHVLQGEGESVKCNAKGAFTVEGRGAHKKGLTGYACIRHPQTHQLDQENRLAARAHDLGAVGEELCPQVGQPSCAWQLPMSSRGQTRSTKPSLSYSFGCQRTS